MRIVIVSFFFPPDAGPGAIRPHALATELAERGHAVTVLTACPDPQAISGVRIAAVAYTRFSARLRLALSKSSAPGSTDEAPVTPPSARRPSRIVSFAARTMERIFQHPDKYRGWVSAVDSWWLAEGRAMAAPDLVVATTPPVSAALAGARIARRWRCPLVLDFRDLWTENPYYRFGALRRAIDQRTESRLVARASLSTVATEAFRTRLQRQWPNARIRLVRTGVLARPVAAHPQRNAADAPMIISHFGSMDAWVKRDPRPVFEAASRLMAAGTIPPGGVRFEFYGPAGPDFLELAEPFVRSGLVTVCGTVDHEHALQKLAASAVALLMMWPGDHDSVPMKATEYMSLGKTIVVTGAAKDSEIRHLLHGTPGVHFADDPAGIDRAIVQCWQRFAEGRDMDLPDPHRARPFLAETMASEFERLFGEVLSDRVAGDGVREIR